jgi:LPXTG-site transpeptidase (sortase) family protein
MPTVNIASGVRVFPLEGTTWAIDPHEQLVGHFEGTAWLTENSNIVLGGHSEMPNGAPGIFARLYNVKVGDPIIVQDGKGDQRKFVVTEIRNVHYTDVSVVMPNGRTQLTLITCDIPSFDASTQTYDERLVVIARPGA